MLKNWQNRGILFNDVKRYSSKLPLRFGLEAKRDSVLFILVSLIPTFGALIIAEAIGRYTASGYSVIVMVLLTVMLYTALKSGLNTGLFSALVFVLYNFYLVSDVIGVSYFSRETLESGAVIAVALPLLALVIGRLKERIDRLLLNEQLARLKAEESANQLEFMAAVMPQKIFTILPNGDSDYVNPQWNEYMGDTEDGNGESNWAEIVHPSDHAENDQHWKHSLETGEPFQYEHRLKRKDGKYRWHLTRATALRDKRGKITLWVGSSTDIEDVRRTKKLEAGTARLIKQRSQLMELNNAKDEFISLASHQLRTPATGVKQYLNMAIDGFTGPISPEVKNILKKANDSNERQL
ncbi:MAG: PAS domain-containing protein, partial [Candidatus Saccharimonadales bacterium]